VISGTGRGHGRLAQLACRLYSVMMRLSGPRAAVTLLTTIPLPAAGRNWPDSGFEWRAAMYWAPLLGLGLGATAAGVLYAFGHLLRAGELLGAVLAIGWLALLTSGMHLDGLADLADGLASRRPADAALAVMKRSDLGPIGAVTLVFVLLIQVAALTRAQAVGRAYAALLAAGLTSRLALTWICRRGVPAARAEGLGARVAGSVHPLLVVALSIAAAAFTLWLGVIFVIALVAGLAAAELMGRLAIRRLGGIPGDVLGAAAEVAFTACLLVTALW
jgi:adenosylcobinamide-GDP ribazoletransferase